MRQSKRPKRGAGGDGEIAGRRDYICGVESTGDLAALKAVADCLFDVREGMRDTGGPVKA